MLEQKAEEYVNVGKLKKEAAALGQIEGLLREAVIDLDEAQKTQEIAAHRATFFLAYMAMLRAGRALLLLNGYRPAKCNQHKTIVEVTSLLMGDKASTIVVHFEEVRQKQHALVHNHSNLISELEAHDAFHYALLLVREITKLIKKKDPDFHVSA